MLRPGGDPASAPATGATRRTPAPSPTGHPQPGPSGTRRPVGQVVQQRRLAHTWLTAHHQDPALTHANSLDEPIEYVAFAALARQPCRASSVWGMCRHLTGTDATAHRLAAATGHWPMERAPVRSPWWPGVAGDDVVNRSIDEQDQQRWGQGT